MLTRTRHVYQLSEHLLPIFHLEALRLLCTDKNWTIVVLLSHCGSIPESPSRPCNDLIGLLFSLRFHHSLTDEIVSTMYVSSGASSFLSCLVFWQLDFCSSAEESCQGHIPVVVTLKMQNFKRFQLIIYRDKKCKYFRFRGFKFLQVIEAIISDHGVEFKNLCLLPHRNIFPRVCG